MFYKKCNLLNHLQSDLLFMDANLGFFSELLVSQMTNLFDFSLVAVFYMLIDVGGEPRSCFS